MGRKPLLLIRLGDLQKRITNRPKFFLDYDPRYYDPKHYIPKPLICQILIAWYNKSMTPRHFAEYAKRDPKQYQAFSDSMWNGFVSITKHVPIMGRFFSFTPDFIYEVAETPEQAESIGIGLGEVYNFSQGIENNPDIDTK